MIPQTTGRRPHPFWLENDELHTEIKLLASTFTTGLRYVITLPDGQNAEVRIEPIVQDGWTIRSSGFRTAASLVVHVKVIR